LCDCGKDVKVSVEQRRGFVKRNVGGKGTSAQVGWEKKYTKALQEVIGGQTLIHAASPRKT